MQSETGQGSVLQGRPQGLVLGPLLFTLHTCDYNPRPHVTSVVLCADDTIININISLQKTI